MTAHFFYLENEVRIFSQGYMIHVNTNDPFLQFACYPVNADMENPVLQTIYYEKINAPSLEYTDQFNEDTCVSVFTGTYCWRGVWEGRLYFTYEEYFEEDLLILMPLYHGLIIPFCKDIIKSRNPDWQYDD